MLPQSGTGVLVLVQDNFASIVAAIREGRTDYDIKSVISGSLPTHAGEATTMIVALLFLDDLAGHARADPVDQTDHGRDAEPALAFEQTEANTRRFWHRHICRQTGIFGGARRHTCREHILMEVSICSSIRNIYGT